MDPAVERTDPAGEQKILGGPTIIGCARCKHAECAPLAVDNKRRARKPRQRRASAWITPPRSRASRGRRRCCAALAPMPLTVTRACKRLKLGPATCHTRLITVNASNNSLFVFTIQSRRRVEEVLVLW